MLWLQFLTANKSEIQTVLKEKCLYIPGARAVFQIHSNPSPLTLSTALNLNSCPRVVDPKLYHSAETMWKLPHFLLSKKLFPERRYLECRWNQLMIRSRPRTMDTQWRNKSKISEKFGRCGRQNMLWPYLKFLDWDWTFGCAVKTISSLGVRSSWTKWIL